MHQIFTAKHNDKPTHSDLIIYSATLHAGEYPSSNCESVSTDLPHQCTKISNLTTPSATRGKISDIPIAANIASPLAQVNTVSLYRSSHRSCLALALTTRLRPNPHRPKSRRHPNHRPTWWNHAVIYEIYPRSFQDSNGDGIGDLNGITPRLDYLQSLGVDAIWLAPMYPSPQVDFGYDISNYTPSTPSTAPSPTSTSSSPRPSSTTSASCSTWCSTTPPRSTRGSSTPPAPAPTPARLVHLERRQTRCTPRPERATHGWVVPPNNWSSLFQGSAWEWVPAVGQFYYHFFYKQQPDLNWRNPAVEKAMFDAMRFWLDRGVAGFRLDAITTLFEDPQLRDEPLAAPASTPPASPSQHTLTSGLPEVHDVLRRLRKMIDSYPDKRVLVGEIYVPTTADLLQWYGTPAAPELQLPMDTLVGFHKEGNGPNRPNVQLNLAHFRQSISEMETKLDGHQPLLVFDNHDNTRSWDRFGDDAPQPADRQLIATILYTTRSTALTYYGAEIGMTTHTPTRKEDVRDPIGITGWPKEKGRDGERTPMQWTARPPPASAPTPTPGSPSAPTPPPSTSIRNRPARHPLTWTHDMIDLRRGYPALRDGGIVMLDTANPSVLSYVRNAPAGSRRLHLRQLHRAVPNRPPRSAPAGLPQPLHLLTDAPSVQLRTMRPHSPSRPTQPRHGSEIALY